MTGRTHDLAAITTLTFSVALTPLTTVSLATGITALFTCIIGGLTPDIDQPTADFWHKLPAGSIVGRIISPLLENHRMISHSLFGIGLFGWGLKMILPYIHTFLLVDINIVWWAFILGYASHLVMDSLTKEGVPWLFPIPIRMGFPPLKFLRITTGSWVEKLAVFPGLILLNGGLVYFHYAKFTDFFTHYLIK